MRNSEKAANPNGQHQNQRRVSMLIESAYVACDTCSEAVMRRLSLNHSRQGGLLLPYVVELSLGHGPST